MSTLSRDTLDVIEDVAEDVPSVIPAQPPAYSLNAQAYGSGRVGQKNDERQELLSELGRWLKNGPVGGVRGRSRTAAREMELREGAPSPLFNIENYFRNRMDRQISSQSSAMEPPLPEHEDAVYLKTDRDSDFTSDPLSPWSASNKSYIRTTSCSSPATTCHSNYNSPRPSTTWTEPSSTIPFHPLSMLTGAASLLALSRAGCEVNRVKEPAIRVLSAHSNADPYNCKLSSVHSSEGNVSVIEDSHSEISGLNGSIISNDDSGDVTDIEGE